MTKEKKLKDSDTGTYNIGDFVTHTKFGIGEIINVIPDEAIKVKFGKQEKILLLKYNTKTLTKE